MAEIKFSDFVSNTNPQATDEVVGLQSGVNKRTTLENVRDFFAQTFISGSLTTSYLPVATGAGTLGNSSISESSGVVDIGAVLKISGTNGFTIGNTAGQPRVQYGSFANSFTMLTAANAFANLYIKDLVSDGILRVGGGVDNGYLGQFNGPISVKTNILISSVTPYLQINDTVLGDSAFVQYGVNASATAAGVYFNIFNQAGRGFSITRGGVIDFELTTAGVPVFRSMPTSAAGLPSGALWNNGGVVNIV